MRQSFPYQRRARATSRHRRSICIVRPLRYIRIGVTPPLFSVVTDSGQAETKDRNIASDAVGPAAQAQCRGRKPSASGTVAAEGRADNIVRTTATSSSKPTPREVRRKSEHHRCSGVLPVTSVCVAASGLTLTMADIKEAFAFILQAVAKAVSFSGGVTVKASSGCSARRRSASSHCMQVMRR